MSGERRRLRLLPVLLAAAALGAAGGAVAGAVRGWDYLGGFGWLFADSVARAAGWTALGLALSALLWLGLLRLGLSRPGERSSRADRRLPWLAALAVAAPWLALAGWRLNRAWGLRPGDLLTADGLGRNLALAAAGAVLALAAAWWLGRVRRSGLSRGTKTVAGTLVLAAGVAWALMRGLAGGPAEGETAADGGRPHVFVLLVDALRADHVSAYGYPRPTTPAIDSLAADGVLFEQTIAASTFTKSSIASLFTGRYPYQHGVYWGSRRLEDGSVVSDLLPPAETTLAEALSSRGWLTEAWVQNSHLRHGTGFAQGFVDYRDHQGSIDRIHRLAERFLDSPATLYPLFVYLHYIDLHDPYRPAAPYDTMFGGGPDGTGPYAGVDLAEWGAYLDAVRRGEVELEPATVDRLRDLYDGQLRAIDDEIGRFLVGLRRRGLYDDSLIVLTSDHGDGFYEHGFVSHSTVPYEELVRVPLIVKLPGGRWAGRRVERSVRSIDLLPTVIAVTGGIPPAEIAGCNLLPLLRGGDPPDDCAVAMVEIAEEGAYPVVAARSERWKYIHHQKRPDEVYDLRSDPGELRDLGEGVAAEVEAVADLRRRALAAVAARAALANDRIELDEETIRELKGLGYIG